MALSDFCERRTICDHVACSTGVIPIYLQLCERRDRSGSRDGSDHRREIDSQLGTQRLSKRESGRGRGGADGLAADGHGR